MIESYVSRWDFILAMCRDKRVLHLGCIGETLMPKNEKVQAMLDGKVLHARLREVAKSSVGVDYDKTTVEELAERGFGEIVYGDVEELAVSKLSGPFDVIVCGDLIEHLSRPGKVLDAVKAHMQEFTVLVVSTPNAFGLLPFLRYSFGIFREGEDHVLSFSRFTLENLLLRHGFVIEETHSCYNRPAFGTKAKLRLAVGVPFFKLFPKYGGTLLVVARVASSIRGLG